MSDNYTADEDFTDLNFSESPLHKGEYENCSFKNCDFSETDLSGFNFADCEFESCDFTMVKTADTGLKTVQFKQCKLLGFHFENCNEFLFEVDFEACQLDLASFYKRKLKGTRFSNCSLKETDFAEADLTEAKFNECDLSGALFDNTTLEKADLRTTINYTIDPEANRINKARFSYEGLVGLLVKYDIQID